MPGAIGDSAGPSRKIQLSAITRLDIAAAGSVNYPSAAAEGRARLAIALYLVTNPTQGRHEGVGGGGIGLRRAKSRRVIRVK